MENEIKQQLKKRTYCAIYTRKSTTEGLDQDFTSLDNQREACENYVNSQKHEGWTFLQERYDDGGFTGANIERPGLQKLLSDIKEHKVDCVVVYKVDRLSRSLMDFAQLLEFFDKNNVTFVSVTQAFNTNTSMGRLTLNILLSFAQFEREIISERTKDKMAAARKRGQWLGGRAPLGYDVIKETKKLTINPEEAKLVKRIFDLYLQGNSLLDVAAILTNEGLRSKETTSKKGKIFGGYKYSATKVQYLIRSVLYIGKVEYVGQVYDGQQEGIISEETFKKAQELLKQNRVKRTPTKNTDCTSLLTHLLYCKHCNKFMIHTYTIKNGNHKYRYYVCSGVIKHGYKSCPNKSINAQAIEDTVVSCLQKTLTNNEPRKNDPHKHETEAILSPIWDTLYPEEKRRIINTLVKELSYDVGTKILKMTLCKNDQQLEFNVDLKQVRPLNKWHKEKEIAKEPKIRQSLILAHHLQNLTDQGKITNLKETSQWLNLSQARLNHIQTLLLLSPAIQTEIIIGDNQTIGAIPEYKIRSLAEEIDWNKQAEIWQTIKEPLSSK